MTLSEIKSAIEIEIENYRNDTPEIEYSNDDQQMKIFNALRAHGYDCDEDVECVNISSMTKCGGKVFEYILEKKIPVLQLKFTSKAKKRAFKFALGLGSADEAYIEARLWSRFSPELNINQCAAIAVAVCK